MVIIMISIDKPLCRPCVWIPRTEKELSEVTTTFGRDSEALPTQARTTTGKQDNLQSFPKRGEVI